MSISCIVLAGGKSLRLGHDKALRIIGDRSLLQRVVAGLDLFGTNIIIVTTAEHSFPQFSGYRELTMVTDIYPNKGPLGGIYTGLSVSKSFYNLVTACDMPFLNQDLLRYMIQLSPNFDIVVPRVDNMVEPLHAVYSKGCLAPIEYLLKQGNLMVTKLLNLVRVKYIEATEIEKLDPNHLSFFNINTEYDLEKARKLTEVV